MSAQATGDVWEHSSFEGGQLLVHLAIADVVNDVHGNQLWMRRDEVARKARVSRATVDRTLRQLVEAGWLEQISGGGGRGKPSEYVYHLGGKPRHGDTVSEKPRHQRRETASSGTSSQSSIPREPKERPSPSANGRPRKRNENFDALAEVWPSETRAERTRIGKALSELDGADDLMPGTLIRRSRALQARAKRDGWQAPTVMALPPHWSELAQNGSGPVLNDLCPEHGAGLGCHETSVGWVHARQFA